MPDWANIDDVRDRWVGEGFPDDPIVVEQLIDDAEETVGWEYPEIEDRVVGDPPPDPLPEDPLPVERLVMVLCRMVIRHLRNPDGTRQISETQGPFTRFRAYDRERSGDMTLTDEERRMLGYLPGAPTQKAFTVPQPVPTETGYLGGR